MKKQTLTANLRRRAMTCLPPDRVAPHGGPALTVQAKKPAVATLGKICLLTLSSDYSKTAWYESLMALPSFANMTVVESSPPQRPS